MQVCSTAERSVMAWWRIQRSRQTLTHKLGKASARKPRSENKLAYFIPGPGWRAQSVKEKLSHQADITEKLACVRARRSTREERTNLIKGNTSVCAIWRKIGESGQRFCLLQHNCIRCSSVHRDNFRKSIQAWQWLLWFCNVLNTIVCWYVQHLRLSSCLCSAAEQEQAYS